MLSARYLALAATALVTLHADPGVANETANAGFSFRSLVPPNSNGKAIYVTGIYQDQAVGYYTMTNDTQAAFVFSTETGGFTVLSAISSLGAVSDAGVAIGLTADSTSSYTTYDLKTGSANTANFAPLGGTNFTVGGINSRGTIAATQLVINSQNTPRRLCQPFEQESDGSYNFRAKLKHNGLGPVGLTEDNVVVMKEACGRNAYKSDYYLYKDGKRKDFAIPGATLVYIDFVAGYGFGGSFYDPDIGLWQGFTSAGSNLKRTIYAVPKRYSYVGVTAKGPHNEVAGNIVGACNYYHGFIYAKNVYYIIDYPNAVQTAITGFSSTGDIIGYFGSNTDGGICRRRCGRLRIFCAGELEKAFFFEKKKQKTFGL